MARRPERFTAGYLAVLAASFLVAVFAGWTVLADRMNRNAYDWLFQIHQPTAHPAQAAVLGIDEHTLSRMGGQRAIRTILASGLERILPARPAAVIIDLILSDPDDPAVDARLAAVFGRCPNLVLASDLIPGTLTWEEPLPAFRASAAAVGHVQAAEDTVSRVLPLEVIAGRERRWAIALEAARLRTGAATIVESPSDLELGPVRIPATRDTARALYIRYREGIPVISIAQLTANPALTARFAGKTVFVGVTAQTASRDRVATPLPSKPMMTGVEVHAQAFETILSGDFLQPAGPLASVLIALAFTAAAGAAFSLLAGWPAYAAGAAVLAISHISPHIAFVNGIVLPYLTPVWAAWLAVVTAASWQYFVVRRQLRKSESDKARYQQAIHFVTHEMRSPLTAIQGSSELMGRYNLSEEKRKQMAQMINSESKRLARMIQTFLDIERLTDGHTEIKSEPFELAAVVDVCLDRVRPLAERKQIAIVTETLPAATIQGDRELLEYAVYNLLTNAVKYSPAGTTVTVGGSCEGSHARLSVRDQGIGMDEKEIRKIGTKFYRTKRAEASGEAGTGIGLSLVQQIVSHHNGRIEVASAPGKGSCFTMLLPLASACSRS